MAPMCKSLNPVLLVAVDVKGTRNIVDRAFSVPKWLRLARMSEKSELLCKINSKGIQCYHYWKLQENKIGEVSF